MFVCFVCFSYWVLGIGYWVLNWRLTGGSGPNVLFMIPIDDDSGVFLGLDMSTLILHTVMRLRAEPLEHYTGVIY